MPFLTGKTKEVAPAGFQDFRSQLFDFLKTQGFQTALSGSPQAIDLGPYHAAFAQRRAEALAAAKESAGNLTGSGVGNIIGSAAGRSVTEENAFLADLQERARQASANRYLQLLQIPHEYAGQIGYQPGFLDYLFKGAQAAASVIGAAKGGDTKLPRFGPDAGTPATDEKYGGGYA